jgi:hypothetical protein
MRVRFDLNAVEPFQFDVDGAIYKFQSARKLAEKRRLATNIAEYVLQLPNKKYIYLTIVGDEDQVLSNGIERGWYVAEVVSEEDAEFLIASLRPFTDLYR